jgi:hypothetical protein
VSAQRAAHPYQTGKDCHLSFSAFSGLRAGAARDDDKVRNVSNPYRYYGGLTKSSRERKHDRERCERQQVRFGPAVQAADSRDNRATPQRLAQTGLHAAVPASGTAT